MMTKEDLAVGLVVRDLRNGKTGYLVDWYEASGGKWVGVVAQALEAVVSGNNVPIENLEEVDAAL